MLGLKPISAYANRSLLPNTPHVYTHIFEFEELFESQKNVDALNQWFMRNWQLSLVFAVVYLALVYIGQIFMENREKFSLRFPLIMWNLFLAGFSFMGSLRMLPDFWYSLKEHGFDYTVCSNDCAYGIPGFWTCLFVLSKVPELFDTLFIVLRKQKLIFLHWYHHATVLIYCWYSYKDLNAAGRWFSTMNYVVHTVMYSYYAYRAMRLSIPAFVSKLITAGQICQMVAGCFVNYRAWQFMDTDVDCRNSLGSIISGTLMYTSYFVLFFNFFLHAYVLKSGKRTEVKIKKTA